MAVVQISDRTCEQYKAEASFQVKVTLKGINKWELNV